MNNHSLRALTLLVWGVGIVGCSDVLPLASGTYKVVDKTLDGVAQDTADAVGWTMSVDVSDQKIVVANTNDVNESPQVRSAVPLDDALFLTECVGTNEGLDLQVWQVLGDPVSVGNSVLLTPYAAVNCEGNLLLADHKPAEEDSPTVYCRTGLCLEFDHE